MLTAAAVVVAVTLFLVWLVVSGRAGDARRAREMADGTYALRYVYVEDDGTARELTPDQIEYLNTEFNPMDGNRPYIKSRYRQRTPDGKLKGFLLRRKLPRRIRVRSALASRR